MKIEYKTFSNYLELIVSGELTIDVSEEVNPDLIKNECKKRRLKKILINAHNLSGKITIMDRFILAKKFAQSFTGSNIQIAAVSNKDLEYPAVPFFETAAINRGVNVKVFTDIEKAKEWLLTK